MDIKPISVDEAKSKEISQIFSELNSSQNGLSASEAESRLNQIGPNKIPEEKSSLIVQILKYFWGPIPIMIEIAAIFTLILAHWVDFYIILVLLLTNCFVRFYEEFQAGNAIQALRKTLSLKSTVKRDGKWVQIDAGKLVPGDVVRIKLGNIVPADGKLINGDYVSIDQSSLTGESLPVDKKCGDIVYGNSVVKQGEMEMIVTATGLSTYFGLTIKLLEKAHPISHFQKAILSIGNFLIILSSILAVCLVAVQLLKSAGFFDIIQYTLLLIIASIPVALPAVLSITMAIGALKLSKMKAIVSKLEAIEEMAGIDVLCCDKTGTLTQNQLTLGDPVILSQEDPIFFAALASEGDNNDAIDNAIINGVKEKEKLQNFKQLKLIPFDPTSKRAEAEIQDDQGKLFYVVKGAVQEILKLCKPDSDLQNKISKINEELGKKGNRTLGVAKSVDQSQWEFLGLLPLFDPLRDDAKETLDEAKDHGLQIKMLTGDNIAIASEIAKKLGLEKNITVAEDVFEKGKEVDLEKIEKTTTFSQIFPEHKYKIVNSLQKKNHIVAMTGDGVNDAPALKQADVGIAVSGATDAAREASSLILLGQGIEIIIKAIEEARSIFERMKSYATYRITETIRVILFITSCILFLNFYPINALMIILLALLNDLPIIAIAYDNTEVMKEPVRWKIKDILIVASVLGFVGIVSSFLLLLIAKYWLILPMKQLQSFIFLKLTFAGHLTLFAARTRGAFFKPPYPSFPLFGAIVGTQLIAMLIVGFGIFLDAVSWDYIGLLYAYCFFWLFIIDGCKMLVYWFLKRI